MPLEFGCTCCWWLCLLVLNFRILFTPSFDLGSSTPPAHLSSGNLVSPAPLLGIRAMWPRYLSRSRGTSGTTKRKAFWNDKPKRRITDNPCSLAAIRYQRLIVSHVQHAESRQDSWPTCRTPPTEVYLEIVKTRLPPVDSRLNNWRLAELSRLVIVRCAGCYQRTVHKDVRLALKVSHDRQRHCGDRFGHWSAIDFEICLWVIP